MKLRHGRGLTGLKVLFVIIGLFFAFADGSFLIAKWPELASCYSDFSSSLYSIYVCLVPIFLGVLALFYLLPSLLGAMFKDLSAPMFEFLVFISRFFVYFPLTPLVAVLIMLIIYVAMLNPSLFLPQPFTIENFSYWLFFVLLIVNSLLMIKAYRRSRFLDKRR